MSQKITDLIVANDEDINKLLDIPEIKLGTTVNESFYNALRYTTPNCALMLMNQGAIPYIPRMIDMMLNIKHDEMHILQNMLAIPKLSFVSYHCNKDDRAILCEFIRKLSSRNKKYHDIIELLINQGIDINKEDRYGKTPLRLLCGRNEFGLIKMLVDKQVDLNKKSHSGHTALTYSIQFRKDECAQFLIKSGADLDLQMDNGNTALMLAADQNMRDVVASLLNNGASTSIYNNNLYTVLDIVKNKSDRNEDIVRALKENSSTKEMMVEGNANVSLANMLHFITIIMMLLVLLFK
uniref:Uncharacterized protein n=1 Tax=viral metagenome TaxID=1070528 RepID=A0A6C0C6S9_9ZZZZ